VFATDNALDILEAIGFKGNPAKATLNDRERVLQ